MIFAVFEWQHMREEKLLFEKKKKPNCISDYVSLALFSLRGSLTLVSIHGESHMNTYQGGPNRPRKKSLDHICVILSS